MKQKTSAKVKALKIFNIFSLAFLIFCAGILVYSTISYTKNGLVNFFSYSFHVIQTESMEPEINPGDLVIVKSVPYSEINVGDDILFKCEDSTSAVYGRFIVHRVVEIIDAENGIYKTCGINNHGIADKVPSKAEGKAVKVSASMGKVFSFFTNWRSIIIIIALICLVLFTIMQVCSVVANASKLKVEKDKEKLANNAELKEQLKKELLEEMQQQNSDETSNADNSTNAEEQVTENSEEAVKQDTAISGVKGENKDDGGEDKWNIV